MFPKYPGDEGTDWHQADTFAHASGEPQIVWPGDSRFGGAITAWTAFTDATEENGCLRFIPGTHEEMFYDESKKMAYDSSKINNQEKDGIKRGFSVTTTAPFRRIRRGSRTNRRRCRSRCRQASA